MARTVDEGFSTFLSWLTPTSTESTSAKNHRASIESCLKTNFGLLRFFRTGSFGNGTSISGYSDVDYFASLPTAHISTDSNTTLRAMRFALDIRFPNTGVHIDSPAVVAPFGTSRSETTEIVPADFVKRDHDRTTYRIPNGYGGWMTASPEWHNLYISNRNNKLNGKVKSLIRFIKAWKFYRNVPISSFYLEMFVGKYSESETSIHYGIDIQRILTRLANSGLAPIADPMGISGSISACSSASDLARAQNLVQEAANRATHAWNSARDGRISDAFYWYGVLYDGRFPSYY